ncbi:hypothetical protein PAAG_11761 [Paracoccidioides lutzii Pb01]|uniref:Uncharacterized protein n=1 Tax=Paracoccidioides lutzii (strain ATCC MYA-826 / Pb01) TaxID=502779 RepID=A0A0A2VKW4_PARBA|nr:hypothetical protein PAAG_11761 [Paracoccidioides lutzii Pb01]KGQ01524.1 hypothetical protein PAAG_11761 [Paracoccidioides lutzii Pb01]
MERVVVYGVFGTSLLEGASTCRGIRLRNNGFPAGTTPPQSKRLFWDSNRWQSHIRTANLDRSPTQ